MKRIICLLCMAVITAALVALPSENPFIGTWEGSIDNFFFKIVFMYDNMCIIDVKAVQNGKHISMETDGSYSYTENIIRISGSFPDSGLHGLSRINWKEAYVFVNKNNTAFNINVDVPGSGKRVTLSFARTNN